MVMGRNGVDLPTALQDKFNQVGLAHALAASGFQVSLLIGMIVTLTQRLPRLARWSLGTGVVLAYIGLTGIQPAVLRAGIMGIAALLALTSNARAFGHSTTAVTTARLAAHPDRGDRRRADRRLCVDAAAATVCLRHCVALQHFD
jgi:competence protein ComEC